MRVLLTALALSLASASVHASPWAETGDRQLRQDVELLADAGLLGGPISSWPLPWAQISEAVSTLDVDGLPPHLAAAAERLRIHLDMAQQGTVYTFDAGVTNEASLVRDFGDSAREDVDASVQVSHELGGTTINYGVGWRAKQGGKDYHFENVYLAHRFGNWAGYVGFVDTWWGPGQESALLMSNSARPFPKIGIKRLSPDPFSWPVLNLLGPWRFDMFVGRLEKSRNDYQHPLVVGMRFSFKPVQAVEIGLNRTMQLCGKDRPCGFDIWKDAIFAIGSADNTGTLDEPGNQIAGADIRISGKVGPTTAALYGEVIGEDGDGALMIEQLSYTAGGSLTGGIGKGSIWRVGVEYSDTYAFFLTEKPAGWVGNHAPGSTYNHFIYRDGYTYYDRPIGASLDGDSRLFSVTGSLTDDKNRRFYGAVRRANINLTNDARYRISQNNEKMWIGEAGVEWPTRWGDVRVEGRLQTDAPNTPGRSPLKGQIELGLRSRF
ncbi:capsule assembly Wzi family protein [Pedomonas mirosovicensis]|uniref:capsule assembly Wzi family protein n=1 Tax=Pedomonas mirosovicensis TaxID=2908641 RepID=UPI002169F2FF|nr:capsule assembly Wzi family protein [Pedomonas mirosovicensis]MCH8685482.1 capsule assembly Wzi family protein [Pedomonas mirosovicensis]